MRGRLDSGAKGAFKSQRLESSVPASAIALAGNDARWLAGL